MTQDDILTPPHSIEAEESVIGACLVSPPAVGVTVGFLTPEDFYRTSNGTIFKVVSEMYLRGREIDVVTVCGELDRIGSLNDVGGRVALHTMAETVPVATNAKQYADIVKENALRRGLIRTGHEVSELGYDFERDAATLLDSAEEKVFSLSHSESEQKLWDMSGEVENELLSYKAGEVAGGVKTGYQRLDSITGGMHNANLVIIGARPGIGKTALAMNIAYRVSADGMVVFFSLEMSKQELAERLIASVAGVNSNHFRERSLSGNDWAKIMGCADEFKSHRLLVDDDAGCTLLRLQSRARRQASKEKVKLIVIDYLQLLTLGIRSPDRYNEVSTISRMLKKLAKDMNVPVLALSQLNRESEAYGSPKLHHLRESGALEQDADQVWLMDTDEEKKGEVHLHVAKNRHGPIGHVNLAFTPEFCRFQEMAA